ncbi:MAG: type II secretion system F family protein [Phycisphaerales bacterium]|nr:type II secretion system F family protein [Phycisphaerales bacterium]
MAHYRYQSRTAKGELHAGVLVAENATTAASLIRGRGEFIVQLVPTANKDGSESTFSAILNYSSGPSSSDILDFTTQLAVMIRAGISIRAALEGITDQTANPKFKRILSQVRSDVESGKSFSEAISKYPNLFGPLYVNMVRASEMSGSFAKMLDRIASYLTQEIETRKMVIGASIYPGIIALMAIGTTIFLLTFVLPQFAGVFKGKEDALPGPTRFLMSLSAFMVQYWWVIVTLGGGVVVSFLTFIKTDVGGLWWDRFKITMPILRRMFRALYISRSLHTMGELLNAGVPMLDTLQITADVSGNRHYRRLWRSVSSAVRQGKKVQSQLQKTTLLPRAVVQMIGAGEESGRLGETLDEISHYYAKALKDAIKSVTGMIEPLMIVLMGGVVGFIAMAIILPIFKMSNLVSGH